MGGTRGSGEDAVLEMSVVRGMRGVGRVCEMCLAWAWWEVCGERIGFGLYLSCRNRGSVGHVSVFGLWWCVGSWWVAWAREGGEMYMCVMGLDYSCR